MNRNFFKEDKQVPGQQNGQEVHENVFNITNHKGNENQNVTPVMMVLIKKQETTGLHKRVEKREP